MNLSRFATQHIKAILFVTVVLCAIGGWLVSTFPVAILPEVTFPRIVLIADSGDRPARMMVAGVTRPLEEAIATVPGVTRMLSKTQRGAVEISIDFTWGTDMLVALQLVNGKVNEARVPGVARVVVQGGRVPEIAVTVDPRRLAAYHLSMPDVEQALTQTDVVRSVGRMDQQFQQYQVLVSGETTTPEQLGNLVVVQR